jgi:CRISPR-associated endonuclease Csn1
MLKRVLGVDVGISSIGWSLVEFQGEIDNQNLPNGKILASGVRIFTQAENPKNGESLAKPRRDARLARRRNRRRSQRLTDIKDLFLKHTLVTGIPRNKINSIYKTEEGKKDPWTLRKEALYRKLDGEEFARVLTHIAKHRGFKSMRKSESEGSDAKAKETQRVLNEIGKNADALKTEKWQTAGEMIASRPEGEARRNKTNNYHNSISRKLLQDEVKTIFAKQREFNLKEATSDLEKQYTEIAFRQKPIQSIAGMVGKCTFEKDQKRAPKNSYSAELFTALGKINNIILKPKAADRPDRPLNQDERNKILALCHENKSGVTFKQIRKELSLSDEWLFNLADYNRRKKDKNGKEKDPEGELIFKMAGYNKIRAAVTENCGETEWEKLKADTSTLNVIAGALATEKNDDAIINKLKEAGIGEKTINAVLELNFSKFIHLSTKALDKINPFLAEGYKYTEACDKAGYKEHMFGTKGMLLRTLNEDENDQITNPVAKRAITQFRKVINAIIREYGKFDQMNIELARELSNSFEKRKEILAGQDRFRTEKEEAAKECRNKGVDPNKKNNLLKFRLWKEQDDGFCVYCGKKIEIERLAEDGYAEVDHILPWSRSLDDSRHNKVLCHIHDNQLKRGQIPFEFLGGDGPKWDEFVGRINSQFKTLPKPKKNRLLKRKFDEEDMAGFKERNINDTRYISRFIKNFVEHNLEFAESSQKQKVFVRSGALTAFLRHQWGLTKKRDERDRHHALDAIVTACATQGMVKFASDTAQKLETYDWINKVPPRFDPPWQNFRDDVQKSLEAVFVSRAPRHKVRGAAHKETIRSIRKSGEDSVIVEKKPLVDVGAKSGVTLKDIEKLYRKDQNIKLYETLKKRLETNGNDPVKAFGNPEDPARMPTNDKTKAGPIIKGIKIVTDKKAGVKVRKGIADNGEIARLDVYEKKNKFYIVPNYVADFTKKELPKRAVKAFTQINDWPLIDSSFKFKFSLFKDDLISLKQKADSAEEFFYYKGPDVSTASITVESIDRSKRWKAGKENVCHTRIGTKTLKAFKKFQLDLLGKSPIEIKQETRVGVIRKNGVANDTGNKTL